jgi:hypothetical protein
MSASAFSSLERKFPEPETTHQRAVDKTYAKCHTAAILLRCQDARTGTSLKNAKET